MRITKEEIQAVLVEFERKWRSRVPATSPYDALPLYKVPWSEVLGSVMKAAIGRQGTFQDRVDLRLPINSVLRRLKKEFPNLQW